MSFSSLSAAWLFALLVPLVIFYFLKLKRLRHTIPSLVLWRQVLADQRVNSPFQKFKRNLLLWLQILLLTLLVLAAMQPFLRREASRAERLPILIDHSASMAALDARGGTSRLDAAKQRVRALIDAMPADQAIALVAFGRSARRLTGFTNDRRELRDALDALAVEDVPSDLEEALRMAQALARTAPFERVMLFSDGNFPARTGFELPFAIDFQRLPQAGENHGIISLTARRAAGGKWDVFVQLAASANAVTTSARVELLQDEVAVASESVTLSPGVPMRLAFQLGSDRAAMLHAKLSTTAPDSLAADNSAWLELPAARLLTVFCGEKLTACRHALQAIEGIRVFPENGAPAPARYDLVITDQADDLVVPARTRCSIGVVPEELRNLITVEQTNTTAIDWRRESPLLQHVSLTDVIFTEQPTLGGAGADRSVAENALANLGYEILIHGPRGPLMVQKQESDDLRIALLFHTDRSTLPYRVGFPIFVANVVQMAMRQSGLAEAVAGSTGVLTAQRLTADQTYRIEGPGRLARDERTDASGLLSGISAPLAGEYLIYGPGANPRRVGASLLSATETSLAGVDQIEFADQLRVKAATTVAKSDRSLWWALALAGFVVLLVEWWWFQRRPVQA